MSDWIVSSKLSPSVALREPVVREPLMERLEDVLNARAAIVHAPAGYGKTTLLAQWREALSRRGIPVAWLSLDEYDTDLYQFLNYLIRACVEGGFAAGFENRDANSGVSGSPAMAIRAAVVTALNRCQGPHVIILDDFHRADGDDIRAAINTLLSDLPPNIHVVISTRSLPADLALASLRVRDLLVEITQSQLPFSTTEIRGYLGAYVEADAPVNWARDLFHRTEGWPIALQTVRRWLSEGVSLDDTLEQISGRSSDLVEYFLEQVFEKLDPDEQDFLLKTSILERVNGKLGNLLCGRDDAWTMLERLERRDLFVNALDRDHAWYRYHRLFSEFLQERLKRQSGQEPDTLHARAAHWFLQHGHTTEALQHALRSKQAGVRAEILEALGGWQYSIRGHVGIVQRVTDSLDDAVIAAHPRVWLARVHLAARVGDLKSAAADFQGFAERYLTADAADPQLEAEGGIMQSLIWRYGDRPISPSEIARLEAIAENLPIDNHAMNAVCFNLLCALYARVGRLEDSMAAGDQAIRHFRGLGSPWGETFIYFHEGLACLAQARLRDAEALYREGLQLAVENFGEDHDCAAIGRALLAEVEYEKNNLHRAGELLDSALDHIERFDAWAEVYLAAYSTAIRLARARRDPPAVAEVARRARATAGKRGLERLARAIERYRLDMEHHDRIAGSGPAPRLSPSPDTPARPDPDPVMHHLDTCVTARGLILDGRFAEAAELLQGEADAARRKRFVRSFITLSLLLATARWKQQRQDDAIAAFENALTAALFEGLKRPFIDEGDLLMGVISELTAASEQRRGNRLRDVFLTELTAEIGRRPAGPGDDAELSPREREVLRYLIQGRSNREIAEAMGLSVNTVKFHLKNVFTKLGVRSRKEAVSATIRQRLF